MDFRTSEVSKLISMLRLHDAYGRKFSYLRLSITDACNFRCQYCLPNGFKPNGPANFLGVDEIKNLATTFAALGTKKIRITGGEPTLRKDVFEIARVIKAAGVETVAISTNAFNLASIAGELKRSGVDQVNVSVDSLDRERFARRTGRDFLPDVLEGINLALTQGFKSVKVNAVLMRENFEHEIKAFQEYVRHRKISVRFIELMPTHDNKSFFYEQHVRGDALRALLVDQGWEALERGTDDGPAFEFSHPDFEGRIGLIAPYAASFCDNCNRLRVTSRGGLRLCLFGEEDYPIRQWLQSPEQALELEAHLRDIVMTKKVSHFLERGEIGNNRSFSVMGG